MFNDIINEIITEWNEYIEDIKHRVINAKLQKKLKWHVRQTQVKNALCNNHKKGVGSSDGVEGVSTLGEDDKNGRAVDRTQDTLNGTQDTKNSIQDHKNSIQDTLNSKPSINSNSTPHDSNNTLEQVHEQYNVQDIQNDTIKRMKLEVQTICVVQECTTQHPVDIEIENTKLKNLFKKERKRIEIKRNTVFYDRRHSDDTGMPEYEINNKLSTNGNSKKQDMSMKDKENDIRDKRVDVVEEIQIERYSTDSHGDTGIVCNDTCKENNKDVQGDKVNVQGDRVNKQSDRVNEKDRKDETNVTNVQCDIGNVLGDKVNVVNDSTNEKDKVNVQSDSTRHESDNTRYEKNITTILSDSTRHESDNSIAENNTNEKDNTLGSVCTTTCLETDPLNKENTVCSISIISTNNSTPHTTTVYKRSSTQVYDTQDIVHTQLNKKKEELEKEREELERIRKEIEKQKEEIKQKKEELERKEKELEKERMKCEEERKEIVGLNKVEERKNELMDPIIEGHKHSEHKKEDSVKEMNTVRERELVEEGSTIEKSDTIYINDNKRETQQAMDNKKETQQVKDNKDEAHKVKDTMSYKDWKRKYLGLVNIKDKINIKKDTSTSDRMNTTGVYDNKQPIHVSVHTHIKDKEHISMSQYTKKDTNTKLNEPLQSIPLHTPHDKWNSTRTDINSTRNDMKDTTLNSTRNDMKNTVLNSTRNDIHGTIIKSSKNKEERMNVERNDIYDVKTSKYVTRIPDRKHDLYKTVIDNQRMHDFQNEYKSSTIIPRIQSDEEDSMMFIEPTFSKGECLNKTVCAQKHDELEQYFSVDEGVDVQKLFPNIKDVSNDSPNKWV